MAFTNSDCDVPACESSLEALQASLDYVNKAQQAKGTSTSSSSSSTPTPAAPPPRPLQREALGHFSWSILHSIAANMPERPNGRERKAASDLVNSVAVLYPCSDCREDFKESVKVSPPEQRTASRTEFAKYICEQHNIVNRK
eukprot:CAMPEP_0118662546 /NCGR_PEP_ID=MMETSP0785-20121206/16891_1 /TAXON_ID=91992 /ORGANISM="Bolidomonas pacifica, Strain CCMP 1866" /LENGTH=141 /DNA_ID=CAMNT_0006556101 /DNA_START=98 /DNA_END=520 /DNA_ORIENTATION=-